MSLQFTLIYRTSKFAESKTVDFETRNIFKKHKLHAQYMTQRKMKVLAKADKYYNSLLAIHQTLAHSTFVIFVMPTEEAQYNTTEQINNLIIELKKETLIENEEFYFVGLVHNGVCMMHEQLMRLLDFNKEQNNLKLIQHTLKNPVAILNYLFQKNITPTIQHYNHIENAMFNCMINKKIYV